MLMPTVVASFILGERGRECLEGSEMWGGKAGGWKEMCRDIGMDGVVCCVFDSMGVGWRRGRRRGVVRMQKRTKWRIRIEV
jgi:hypothetical protein